MNKKRYGPIALIIILCLSGNLHAKEPLILGIHPYLLATEILERFLPLAGYLEKKLERKVEIRVSRNYEEHIEKTGNNKLDIAYMGPASYVSLVERYGKRPVLARLEVKGKPTFQGMIITAKGSSIKGLADLAGKRFAFGDPNSTMSHLVPRYMLNEAGIDVGMLKKYSFMSNHNNVALGVLMGDFDAGAVKEEIYYKYEARGLRVLALTPPISEHIFIASKSLSPETISRVKMIFYNLNQTKEGRNILISIKESVTGLVPAHDKDYDNLRNIIKKLAAKGVIP